MGSAVSPGGTPSTWGCAACCIGSAVNPGGTPWIGSSVSPGGTPCICSPTILLSYRNELSVHSVTFDVMLCVVISMRCARWRGWRSTGLAGCSGLCVLLLWCISRATDPSACVELLYGDTKRSSIILVIFIDKVRVVISRSGLVVLVHRGCPDTCHMRH